MSITEIIKNLYPNEKNRDIPNIDVPNNANLLFHTQIPVPRISIRFSQLIKRLIPVPNLPLSDADICTLLPFRLSQFLLIKPKKQKNRSWHMVSCKILNSMKSQKIKTFKRFRFYQYILSYFFIYLEYQSLISSNSRRECLSWL